MAPSFTVFIDESGDEGLQGKAGQSDWFVISAVIVRTVTEFETVRLVEDVRSELCKHPREPLHFRDLKHEQKLVYVDRIARAKVRAVSVLVHKPSIAKKDSFRLRYRLYFYAGRFLLERVSWCCRDHRREGDGDGTATVMFSNRSGMRYDELRNYMRILKTSSELGNDVSIDWGVIDPDRIVANATNVMGLQLADAVAGSFYRGLEPQRGFVEARYAKMLAPVVYKPSAGYFGCGVKLWPAKLYPLLAEDPRLGWLQEVYDRKK